jgi:hypothetical protein
MHYKDDRQFGHAVAIPLNKVLALVGKLDDSEGKNTARERFRSYLKEEVIEVNQLTSRKYFCAS